MLRRNTLERRLFAWLLVLALLPPLAVLAAALAIGAGGFEWLGTLGPWQRVADSGRDLIEFASPHMAGDSALANAIALHERELSISLVQANRWAFLGQRLGTLLIIVASGGALVLASAALLAARSLAAGLARPIADLVDWSDAMARGDSLPPATRAERHEVTEVRALRSALRSAAERIARSHTRDLESQRVHAWGEMARRVAHEMKNPLTPLRLAAHRLTRIGDSDPAIREAAEVITEETARLDDMARQFAAIGKPPEGPPSEVDVAELLQSLLRTDVPPSIRHSLHVESGTSAILAHYDALSRAFRNLVRNAVQSVEVADGEQIDVRVSSSEGRGVEVTIADDGTGFPPGLAERIFEPDFTLRSGGTGLGLAVVRQVISAHGGDVRAVSRESGGAIFTVRLPETPNAPAPAPDDRVSREHRNELERT